MITSDSGHTNMPCLDVVVSIFWQFARHWKQGEQPSQSCHVNDDVLTCTCLLSQVIQISSLCPFSPSPCSCASCKEEVSLAATHQERQKREAKGNADEAASDLHKIDNIGEDSEKHAILSVSTPKKLKKVSKANTGVFAVKLSEHAAEVSEESHPMLKCT